MRYLKSVLLIVARIVRDIPMEILRVSYPSLTRITVTTSPLHPGDYHWMKDWRWKWVSVYEMNHRTIFIIMVLLTIVMDLATTFHLYHISSSVACQNLTGMEGILGSLVRIIGQVMSGHIVIETLSKRKELSLLRGHNLKLSRSVT
jgi:hypothetical protein